MTSHTDRHEDLVRDVVVGDLSPDDPAVLERLATCPRCARLLDGARRAMALLEHDAAEQDELLELAARVQDAPLDSVDAMRDHPVVRGAHPARSSPRPGGLVAGLAAALALAAAVLATFLVLQRDQPPPDTGPRLLGDERSRVELIEPLHRLSAEGVFTWTVDGDLAQEVGYYSVVVRGDGFAQREVAQTRDTTCTVPLDETDLPERFDWWIVVHGLSGEELERSEPASVRRSP